LILSKAIRSASIEAVPVFFQQSTHKSLRLHQKSMGRPVSKPKRTPFTMYPQLTVITESVPPQQSHLSMVSPHVKLANWALNRTAAFRFSLNQSQLVAAG
jgi:hypothetical protein